MTPPERPLSPRAVQLLTLSTEPWLSCDDCFSLMDVYVERVLATPRAAAMPQMRVHLAGCQACAEEAQSLFDFVASNPVDPPGGSTAPIG